MARRWSAGRGDANAIVSADAPGIVAGMLRWVLLVAFFTAVLRAQEAPEPPKKPATGAKVEALDKLAAAVSTETNRVRKQHGRGPLHVNTKLNDAAADQATYMALRMRASHSSSIRGQENVLERVRRHGVFPVSAAENVQSFKLDDDDNPALEEFAARLVTLWMGSPGHRETILRRDLADLGCAVRFMPVAGGQAVFAVQVFTP